MNTLHIRYEGLSPSWVGDAVTGQEGTLRCRFILDESWDKYPIRYMVVTRAEKIFDPVLISEENEAEVPSAALKERSFIMIGLVGIGMRNGKVLRYNSRPCRVIVDQGNLIWEPEEEIDINVYEQLLGKIAEIDETIAKMQKDISAKLDAYQGIANAGKLLYVGEDGKVALLQLGTGLEILDGRLCITGAVEPGEPDVPPITFEQTAEDTVTVRGTVFAMQDDGTVLWSGAAFFPGEEDTVYVQAQAENGSIQN